MDRKGGNMSDSDVTQARVASFETFKEAISYILNMLVDDELKMDALFDICNNDVCKVGGEIVLYDPYGLLLYDEVRRIKNIYSVDDMEGLICDYLGMFTNDSVKLLANKLVSIINQ